MGIVKKWDISKNTPQIDSFKCKIGVIKSQTRTHALSFARYIQKKMFFALKTVDVSEFMSV